MAAQWYDNSLKIVAPVVVVERDFEKRTNSVLVGWFPVRKIYRSYKQKRFCMNHAKQKCKNLQSLNNLCIQIPKNIIICSKHLQIPHKTKP